MIVHKILGQVEAREEHMARYAEMTKTLLAQFAINRVKLIPREENTLADSLSKIATEGAEAKGVHFLELVRKAESSGAKYVMEVNLEVTWMTPIMEYLKNDVLPESPKEAKRVMMRVARYVLIDGILYVRGYSEPFLHCLTPNEANYILREIYEGITSAHERPRLWQERYYCRDTTGLS